MTFLISSRYSDSGSTAHLKEILLLHFMGIVTHLEAAFICMRQLLILWYLVVVVSAHFSAVIRADCVAVTSFILLKLFTAFYFI